MDDETDKQIIFKSGFYILRNEQDDFIIFCIKDDLIKIGFDFIIKNLDKYEISYKICDNNKKDEYIYIDYTIYRKVKNDKTL